MGGFILLFLIVIVMAFVVPAVALAKASRALRAIEELKQRLLMLEARLHRGGVPLKRKENVVTAQTLCATGILILYAVTFACRSFYHFPFFGLVPTFALMSLITPAAFLLAVQLDALVVAILGIGGGFLTPVLLSTGQDNPLGLFGYIALLDIGLLAVARRKEWSSLPILGAVGTVLMQIAWVGNFFLQEKYFSGNKTLIPMAVFLGFEILFLLAALTSKRAGKLDNAISGAV